MSSPPSSPSASSSQLSPDTGMTLSPTSIALIVLCLSLFTLAVIAITITWIRRRWSTPKASNKRPSEKEVGRDVEALAASRLIIPVEPLPDVRWAPQIRSISGPAPEDEDKKYVPPPPKRARSPPPSNYTKPRNLLPEPYPKSAPAHALSFLQDEPPHQAKSRGGELSPPVTPHALAVSGMQTRSLGKPGLGSKS